MEKVLLEGRDALQTFLSSACSGSKQDCFLRIHLDIDYKEMIKMDWQHGT
jgi:hypothetical protein